METANISHSKTADGSSTLYSERHNALYHSQHGAVTESKHIFIEAGFKARDLKSISILEVGFGTGLNAALTAFEALLRKVNVIYHAIELYPLAVNDYKLLNYSRILEPVVASAWNELCALPWNHESKLNPSFKIEKSCIDFTTWQPMKNYDLVYFDAFAPDDQPEMWSAEQFQKVYDAMNNGGALVTYCVKGIVKEALRAVGFQIERLPGPPGKNHILRAWKKMKIFGINK
ncbi:MAG: tRNA (5-methylaminomethyl-2-thiouridine)(34)-methyltransferase MnmD [Bacteroidales bacterium]